MWNRFYTDAVTGLYGWTKPYSVLSSFMGQCLSHTGCCVPSKHVTKPFSYRSLNCRAWFRSTFMMISKHVIQELLTYEDSSKPDLSSVKCVVSVGASSYCLYARNDRVRPSHESMANSKITNTRLGSLTWFDGDVPLTGNTVGELLPNIQAMTVDKNNRPLERGQQGDIWYKSPSIMIQDMFNFNGSDISGSQIEGSIILHPDVKEASVIPVTL